MATGAYRNGTGSVPVETSEDREEYFQVSGLAKSLSDTAFDIVLRAGENGITGKELRSDPSTPAKLREYANGTSALTNLYAEGYITRLKTRRDGGMVYIGDEFVHGRDTVPYRPARLRKYNPDEVEVAEQMKRMLEQTSHRSERQNHLLSFLEKAL